MNCASRGKYNLVLVVQATGFGNAKVYAVHSRECVGQSGGPLDGVRILDMTRILAGPFCTMLLGDLGAEILKVENPDGGDETRRWGPPFINGESTYFLSVNRNKKSISINIKKPEGSNLVRQLAAKSDVLVENYVTGKLAEFGLDYDTLKNVAPHLIYCSITGYGSTGPYGSRAGYDIIAASLGGLLHITGPEEGEPCKVGVAMTDLSTGLYAHGAIMAALLQRKETGKGQKIECNLLSTQVSLLANLASNYLNSHMEAKRWGTAHESIVPYEAFKTLDGYITVGAGSDKQFKVLCTLLGMESVCEDQRYLTNKDRVHNRKALISLLSKKFEAHSTDYWLHLFEGSGIPYGSINNMEQVFSDPQVLHNQMITEMSHKSAGSIRLPGPAVSFSESTNKPRSAPPVFGQHTNEILSDILGLSDHDVNILRNKKIIV